MNITLIKDREIAIGECVSFEPFHVPHNVTKVTYQWLWYKDGHCTETVKWELRVMKVSGGNNASLEVHVIEQKPKDEHVLVECPVSVEPDDLLMAKVKRVSNGGVDNTSSVFFVE